MKNEESKDAFIRNMWRTLIILRVSVRESAGNKNACRPIGKAAGDLIKHLWHNLI